MTQPRPGPDERRLSVDDQVHSYLARMHGAQDAYLTDATYSAQIRWLRGVLDLVDMVLTDEGVPAATRERVTRCILYGSPDPATAEARIDRHRAYMEAVSRGDGLVDLATLANILR